MFEIYFFDPNSFNLQPDQQNFPWSFSLRREAPTKLHIRREAPFTEAGIALLEAQIVDFRLTLLFLHGSHAWTNGFFHELFMSLGYTRRDFLIFITNDQNQFPILRLDCLAHQNLFHTNRLCLYSLPEQFDLAVCESCWLCRSARAPKTFWTPSLWSAQPAWFDLPLQSRLDRAIPLLNIIRLLFVAHAHSKKNRVQTRHLRGQ